MFLSLLVWLPVCLRLQLTTRRPTCPTLWSSSCRPLRKRRETALSRTPVSSSSASCLWTARCWTSSLLTTMKQVRSGGGSLLEVNIQNMSRLKNKAAVNIYGEADWELCELSGLWIKKYIPDKLNLHLSSHWFCLIFARMTHMLTFNPTFAQFLLLLDLSLHGRVFKCLVDELYLWQTEKIY